MNKRREEAIKYLQRVIKTSKETAYNLVYQDIDIQCLEIVLNYIEELEGRKNTSKELIDKIIESTQLVSKDGEKFEFKEIKKEL